jgi:hypothetical protein
VGGRNDESAGTWSRRSTASISEKGKKNRRIMRLPANWPACAPRMSKFAVARFGWREKVQKNDDEESRKTETN